MDPAAGWALAILGLLLGAGLAYQLAGQSLDARRFPPPGRLIDIGGRRLHAHVLGEGRPAVVLESGIAASSINWTLVHAASAAFTRTMAYDRAGYAWSDPARSPRTSAACADDLHALLQRLGLDLPCVLVGHSFGGLVVRSFVRRHPEAVAGLVFVDTIFPEDWRPVPPERRRMLRGGVLFSRIGVLLARLGVVRACLALLTCGRTAVPRAVAGSFGRTATTVLARILGEVLKMPAERRPAIQAHWSRPRSFGSMASHLAALPASAEDLADADPFGDIPVVVVVARGLRDDVRRQHDELARRSSRGRVIEAAVGGHWVHLDEPGLVVSAIREVVDAARRRWPHPTHDTENAECAEKSTAAHAERAEGLTAEHAENADEIDRRARGGSS